MTEVEQLLRSALVPVEPSEALSDRLERGLSELRDAAVEELADWELSAMRDPRNWARPLAALVVGGLAGGALIVLRARHGRRRRPRALGAVEQGARDAVSGIERRLRR
jgi:hypothetical protein